MNNEMLSDKIESFILDLLGKQSSDEVLLKRKDVAELLECAPSQVTYVINTRFSSNNRFIVESRRGNGGYIKIALKSIEQKTYPNSQSNQLILQKNVEVEEQNKELAKQHLINYFTMLYEYELISAREYQLMKSMAQITLNYCPGTEFKSAARSIVQNVEWILKGE